jgi:hypothetical protein
MLVVCRLEGEEERVSGAELVREEDGDSPDWGLAAGSSIVGFWVGVVIVDVRRGGSLGEIA